MDRTEVTDSIAAIWDELPGAVGGGWNEFEHRLLGLLRRLDHATGEPARDAVRAVIALFRENPAAYELLVHARPAAVGPRTKSVAASVSTRPPAARYVSVAVHFATDRHDTGHADASQRFSGARGPEELQFGVAQVAIPDTHREPGQLEAPKWWKLQFRSDPDRHITLLDLKTLGDATFVAGVRDLVGRTTSRDVLVFVHGYNVAFPAALMRTAQLAWDLNFQGVPMTYSWPSESRVVSYPVDESNIGWTQEHFLAFLRKVLVEVGAESVHVIAHSMGSRALADTLRHFDPGGLAPGAARLRQVVFAAPDIDSGTFRQIAVAFRGRAERFTLYSSSADRALAASQGFHGYPRAGDSGDGLVVIEGVDTIDASSVDTSLLGLGHSYFSDVRIVLDDLIAVLCAGRAPDARKRLASAEAQGRRYWRLTTS